MRLKSARRANVNTGLCRQLVKRDRVGFQNLSRRAAARLQNNASLIVETISTDLNIGRRCNVVLFPGRLVADGLQ